MHLKRNNELRTNEIFKKKTTRGDKKAALYSTVITQWDEKKKY